MMIRTVLMALLFLPLLCQADATLYKWKDAQGTVHFSDQPQPGAEKMEVRDIQTVPAIKGPPAGLPDAKKPASPTKYDVAIVSPANDATLHDNTGDISVRIQVTPPLRADLGHKIQLWVDGAPHGEPGATTQFTLNNIDRGTHNLKVSVLDNNGGTLASASSVFYLHRHSVLLGPNAKKPAGGN